jgi:hypothetical protein
VRLNRLLKSWEIILLGRSPPLEVERIEVVSVCGIDEERLEAL